MRKLISVAKVLNPTLLVLIGSILLGAFMFRFEYQTLSVSGSMDQVLGINRFTGLRCLVEGTVQESDLLDYNYGREYTTSGDSPNKKLYYCVSNFW
jgi:hypothetical protein